LDAFGVLSKALAVAERQVVDEAPDQPMIDVKVRQPVIALWIMVVEEPLPAVKPARPDPGTRRFRVGALRPGVREGEQRASTAMFELGVEGVVVRAPAPDAVDGDAEIGKRA